MIARKTLNISPGGDTVQVNSTAKYLRELGVNVHIASTEETVDYSRYDLMHFFNIIRPDDILVHIQRTRLPYVVSTIFVDYSEYEKRNRRGLLGMLTRLFDGDQVEYLKAVARYIKNGDRINSKYYLLNGHRASVKYVASHAKMLLPNSESEYKRFLNEYQVPVQYRKVPNAIDNSIFEDSVVPDNNYHNHVLCVGRIEGRKNQLNLIKALANTELKLTLIGKPSPNHMAYYKECTDVAASCNNVRIIEHLDHDALPAIYKAAKVHVLPSWFETTGLSSLEAGIMECNLVVTKKGDTCEYFEDMAWYCEPEDIDSIKDAVFAAYHADTNLKLKQTILEQYTWAKTAEETLITYKEVLKKR